MKMGTRKPIRYTLKAAIFQLPRMLQDVRSNRRWATAGQRFLIVRYSGKLSRSYHYVLQWLEGRFPQLRSLFELRLLPCRIRDWSPYVLHASWLQDPVEDWSTWAWSAAREVAARCEQRQVPVINRVDLLSNGVKSVAARILSGVGIRTPRILPVQNIAEFRETLAGLSPPLLVREDRGHGKPGFLIEKPDDVRKVPLGQFSHPIAVEFIDVRSPADGLYRKYRYLATGDEGVTRHLIVGNQWELHAKDRVVTPATQAEELAFLRGTDPNEVELQRARVALGLDLVGFDYSYDRGGRLVVWEANSFPNLNYPKNPLFAYTYPYVERSFAALVTMYLKRAGLKVPQEIEDMLAPASPLNPPVGGFALSAPSRAA